MSKLGQHELTYLQWCQNKKVDGVLIVMGNINKSNIIEIVNSDMAVVSTDICMPNLDSVIGDDDMGVRLAIEHAVAQKRRHIMMISGPDSSRSFVDRMEAFRRDMHKRHLVYEESDIVIADGFDDVARNLSRLKMSMTRRDLNGNPLDIYHLIPESSYRMAKDDIGFFHELEVTGLQSGNLGNTLFSTYDDGMIYERSHALGLYEDIASLYDGWLLVRPNSYMYQHLDGYMDMPITNSQFDYYTDLVPLIPIILKGTVSYYTPYLNFNALGEDRILMMIDFAINPSYVLTEKPTYEMRFTNASMYYTTERRLYQESIIDTYNRINDVLSLVIGAKVLSRDVLITGLSKVTYDNGVVIYVNYTFSDQTVQNIAIKARSFEVTKP